MTDSNGFMITDLTGSKRRRLALTVLEKRLEMSIHFKRTDSYSLQQARAISGTEFRTTKQALAWVSKAIEEYKALDAAEARAQEYIGFIADQGPEHQTDYIFDAIVAAFLLGWEPTRP